MSSADWLLSVDFGTSNTAAAHSAAVTGAIESLSLSHTSNLMPSGVFVDAPDRIAVGEHAANEAERNPAAYIPAPKRLVGQPSIAANGFTISTAVPIAAVLRTVFSRATAVHAGQMPTHLVLTHPEAWSPGQIQILVDAAVTSGMPPGAITTISEPRAAAAHYARSNRLGAGARIAVFDFGGGTLDVAVLSKDADGTFTVLAARGDNGLGGKNFDALIRQWVDHQLEARNPDLLDYLRRDAPVGVRHQLDDSIRRAKELLSETPSATITAAGGGFHETFQLTRDELDELIAAPIDAAVAVTQATFADAGITSRDQLSALYLTGGTSRIPLVHRTLLTIGPVATLDDPKTVVAQGALSAWLAARTQRPEIPGADSVMGSRDSTSPTNPVQSRGGTGPSPRVPHGWSDVPSNTGPQAVSPTPPMKRRRGPLIAGALVLVAVAVAGVVAAVTLTGGDDSASPTPTPSAAAGQSSTAATSLATTQEQVLAVVPTQLSSTLTECRNSGFTQQQGIQVTCKFASGASTIAGLGVAGDSFQAPYVVLSVDEVDARKAVVANRQGNVTGDATLVESADKTATASIYHPNGESTYLASYANNTKFLIVKAWNLAGVSQAKTFLSRAGLIA